MGEWRFGNGWDWGREGFGKGGGGGFRGLLRGSERGEEGIEKDEKGRKAIRVLFFQIGRIFAFGFGWGATRERFSYFLSFDLYVTNSKFHIVQ